jgi:hypothetical protein
MRISWALFCGCIILIAPLAAAAQASPAQVNPCKPTIPPAANRPPAANDQMKTPVQQPNQQKNAATDAERKKQLADDTAKLLKLATDLKGEVDKTSKDTLSLNVIRKADEIEKLAHNVKEKMKLTVGAN